MKLKTKELTTCALFAALIAVGAFIKIDIPLPMYTMHFTLQWFFVLMAGFLLAVWLLGLPKVTAPMQLLPLIGTSLGTIGLFRLQGIPLRLCMMAVNLFWLAHNLWLGSLGGSLIESSFFVVNLVTIYRLHRSRVMAE